MEDAIRYAKKYYFWPLSLIVLLLALYLWYGTVSSMDKEFTDRESALKQVNSSMSSISSTAPNEEVIQLIQKKCRSLKRDVSSAWNLLYEKQNANNTWPEITSNGKVVDFTARKVPQDGCEQYRYRIVEEFKSLVETLDLVASNTSESGGVAARAGAPVTGAANPNEYITEEVKPQTTDPSKKELVIWDEKSIDELSKSHFAWERIPKSNQILVAQEDFWLFKNIIDAIKSVNQGVETRNNAKLKMVKDIQITKQASDLFKQRQEKGFFDVANFKKASADNAGMLDTQGAPTIDGQSSTSDGGSGEPLNKEFRELYDWRYVDDNGAALTAEQYNTQKNVSETRNVPVYISLIINQSCPK